MNKSVKIGLLALGCSLIGAASGVAIYTGFDGKQAKVSSQTETTELSGNIAVAADVFKQPKMTQAVYSPTSVPENFVEAAERSINGVVNIRTETVAKQPSRRYIDPFEFFFGIPGDGPRGDGGRAESPVKIGIGSGVIISTDGFIITNNHVISGATRITVTTNTNETFEATLVGTDPETDIALIKIEASGLSPIPFGDSESLRVGEWVLAVGNPFNLSSTVTAGIVSAKGRSTMQQGDLKIASFIQTDAAVNPGNSGGALVNARGELVGINTMIYSRDGSFSGYSFAVPVSIASKVVADIKQYGTVQRAVLGIVGTNVIEELKKEHNLKVTQGAVVVDFGENSSAKAAGIKEGDVITAVNGIHTKGMAELQEQISKYRPGDHVTLSVNRQGEELSFKVELKNREGNTDIIERSSVASLGAAFKPIDEETATRLGISSGVVVVGVDKEGKFHESGINKGFVILAINNTRVRTGDDVERIVEGVVNHAADKVLFIKGIYPNGRVRYVAVDLT
ncbi:MAG: Do family serine endopeptidase [Porphyromonas sp.]|nr:Do family serine endopeptidase [Porphyromonas sp.]